MKYLFLLSAICFITASAWTQTDSNQLKGKWKIDLRPTPNAEAYYQSLEVSKINENVFSGKFYGSKIKNGFINKSWNKLYFAFTTSDSNHDYYHSGYLFEGKLYGMSYCPGRSFMAPWSGQLE